MADRGEVAIRERKLAQLIHAYEDAYQRITVELVNATDAAKIRKAHTLRLIENELDLLGVDIEAFIKAEIPQYYYDGANIAKQDLDALGVSTQAGVTALDKRAIEALMDEVGTAFAEGMTGVKRSSSQLLSQAIKEQIRMEIALGKIKGDARRTIVESIKQKIKDGGIHALVDRGGNRWSFDAYANMLVRTKSVEARNTGLGNKILETGRDLVQVSNHHSKHDACAYWEGKILSYSGLTPVGTELAGGYVVAGTYDQAKASGLFHPNCQHAINVINPEIAAITHAYDNTFNTR